MGRPHVGDGHPRFSVTHAGDLALIAVSEDLEIGVDAVWLGESVRVDELAPWLPRLQPGASRAEALREWTVEEARRKAAGVGFAADLPEYVLQWPVLEVEAPEGFVATLVVEGKETPTVRVLDYEP